MSRRRAPARDEVEVDSSTQRPATRDPVAVRSGGLSEPIEAPPCRAKQKCRFGMGTRKPGPRSRNGGHNGVPSCRRSRRRLLTGWN
jgi:hypothetical protein